MQKTKEQIMTRAEERNKAAFEAYPENISYSTVIEQMVDYNLQWRQYWLEGAEWADKTMIEKACKWLRTNYEDIGIRYIRGHKVEDEIESFKKAMEEQIMAKSFCSGCKHWIYIPASEANGIGFHFCDIYDKYELKFRKLWCNGKLKEE